jgi:hypothetical protein
MKSYLPYYFKHLAFILIALAFVLSILGNLNDSTAAFKAGWNHEPITSTNKYYTEIITSATENTLITLSLICSFCGFLMYMFSKEKDEDEFIQQLRYTSLAKSLLFTWILASILFLINGDIKMEGFYILQFHLIAYTLVYNYYKKMKFA